MSKKIELKEEIHHMNGLIGRLNFSVDELFDLQENDEKINEEILEELQVSFNDLKETWKRISSAL
jgi:hypothetical protein